MTNINYRLKIEDEKIKEELNQLKQKLPPGHPIRETKNPTDSSIQELKQRGDQYKALSDQCKVFSDQYKALSMVLKHYKNNISELVSNRLAMLQTTSLIKAAANAIKSNFDKQAQLITGEAKESKQEGLTEKIEIQFKNFQTLMGLIQEVANKDDRLLSVAADLDKDQLEQLGPLLEGKRIFIDVDKNKIKDLLKENLKPLVIHHSKPGGMA